MVTITIDGQRIEAAEGERVLEVARRNDIFIPSLCFLEGLTINGSCRLCMVQVDGGRLPQMACATPVREGMEVVTNTEALRNQQRMLLQLLFASGQHVCAVCEANGYCELQALAQRLGMTHIMLSPRWPMAQVDLTHEHYGYDINRCVMCQRCIRACEEIEGAGVWAIRGHHSEERILPGLSGKWGEADNCTNCGKCVMACPTGALFDKQVATAEMKKDCGLLVRLVEHRERLS